MLIKAIKANKKCIFALLPGKAVRVHVDMMNICYSF